MQQRILHLIYRPRHSGAESLVRDLCIIHQHCGIRTAIAALTNADAQFLADLEKLKAAGTSLFIPGVDLNKADRIFYFAQALHEFRPSVVFAHSVIPSLYGRLALPLIGSKPRFATVLHSATQDDFADPYLRFMEQILMWRADAVVAVSNTGAEAYRRRIRFGAPVSVILNGIDVSRFEAVDRSSARFHFGLSDQQRIILQVGRISPVKQQDFSVRALTNLLKSEHGVELWFAGLVEDSDYEQSIKGLVRQLELTERVKFLGSRADVPELLAAADLYIMPSLQEAHSVAVLEALASGIPILASDIESFHFAAAFDGVQLVGSKDTSSFAAHAGLLLSSMSRYPRELGGYDIRSTASAYANMATTLDA